MRDNIPQGCESKMKTVIIILGTLAVTFIIISPFFWLRFLYRKDRKLYVFYSTLLAVGMLILFIICAQKFILGKIASYDVLDVFDGISMGSIYLTLFLSIISPFIFAKIILEKIKIKSFFISLALSIIIFLTYVLVFVYVLLPMAFEELNRRL
jgi:hypothetical protein